MRLITSSSLCLARKRQNGRRIVKKKREKEKEKYGDKQSSVLFDRGDALIWRETGLIAAGGAASSSRFDPLTLGAQFNSRIRFNFERLVSRADARFFFFFFFFLSLFIIQVWLFENRCFCQFRLRTIDLIWLILYRGQMNFFFFSFLYYIFANVRKYNLLNQFSRPYSIYFEYIWKTVDIRCSIDKMRDPARFSNRW